MIAADQHTTSDVIALATDPQNRWTVHAGIAPTTAALPLIAVHLRAPIHDAEPLCTDHLGQLRNVWQLSLHTRTVDQARWLIGAVLSLGWTGWVLDEVGPTVLDSEDEPRAYTTAITFHPATVTR